MSWASLKEHCKIDDDYQFLVSKIRNKTFSDTFTLEDPRVKEFFNVRERLSIVDDVVMYAYEGNELRTVIPKKLRHQMIENIHAAHQGATSILCRAREIMYWPGMDRDIKKHCERCADCQAAAPSNRKESLIPTDIPEYPFQHAASDLFEIDGHHYLVYVDHLTAFAELAYYPSAPSSAKIITTFREFFHRWGVVEEISLDGGPNLDSYEMKEWLKKWGVKVRQSSAYYPQSNGRAEAGVKSLKRLLMGHTGVNGTIHTDAVAQALLQYRNTPLREVNKSPAQLALGRQLRDTVPLPRHRYKISPQWALFLENRERTLSELNSKGKQYYDQHATNLPRLNVGDEVRCQNARTKKWDRLGTVVLDKGHRQYVVKVVGSRRTTTRNRRHLKKIVVNIPDATPNIPNSRAAHETATTGTMPQDIIQLHPSLTPTSPQPPPPTETLPPAQQPSIVQNRTDHSTPDNAHFVRRSSRNTAKPRWYHKEFNSSDKH